MITLKLINGIMKRVQTLVYPSTKTVVERILPINSDIPEEVTILKRPENIKMESHIPEDAVHNMEYAQYAHLAQVNGF